MSEFFKIKLQFILGYAGILLVLISIKPVFLDPIIFSSNKLNITLNNIFLVHLVLIVISIVFYGMIFLRNKFNKNNLSKLFGDIFYLLSFIWIIFVLIGYLILLFVDNYLIYLNRNTIPPLLILISISTLMILFFKSNKYIKKLKIELLEQIKSNNRIEQSDLRSYYKFIYRLIDIALSFGMICFVFPILLITYLLLKLESRASSIVKIKKVGENGKEFYMYKFRTSALSENGTHKTSKIGLFLRRAAVDEMPILFNVLLNKMTLIGPRPLSNDLLEMFDKEYKNLYKKVKPGVFSLSSIVALDESFQNNLNLQGISKIEKFYISKKSFYLDFMITLSAVKLVLFIKK